MDVAPRIVRSAGAAAVSQLWRVAVTFATHLVLRRLVPRADWGLFDWAEVLFLVLGGLRDLGLPPHVLRVKPRPFGNLLAVEAGWGAALALLAVAAAPVLALAFAGQHPLTVPVLRVMALFLFFEGLAAVPRTFYDGELAVGRAVLPEILRNLCFAATAVTLALRGAGVWSMVIAHVVAAAVFAALLWARAHRQIPLLYKRGETLTLVRHSLQLCAVWLLVLLVMYVDRLVLGARFSSEVVGTYGFAYWAAFIVPTIMLFPVTRAAYPGFVAFAGEPERQFSTYRLATLFLLSLEVPTALLLFFNADAVLRLLGGGQWVEAPALLRILCFAPLVDPFGRFGGQVLMTRGQDRAWIASTGLTLAAFVTGGVVLTGRLGPAGMAWANYLPLGAALMTWVLYRADRRGLRRLAGDLAFVYLVPVPLFVAAALAAPGASAWRLGLSLVAFGAAWALYARRFGSEFVGFFRGRGRSPGELPGEPAGDPSTPPPVV